MGDILFFFCPSVSPSIYLSQKFSCATTPPTFKREFLKTLHVFYYHMDNFDIVNSILIEGVITLFDIEYFMKMGEVDIKKIFNLKTRNINKLSPFFSNSLWVKVK
jgi:hypothetical protein